MKNSNQLEICRLFSEKAFTFLIVMGSSVNPLLLLIKRGLQQTEETLPKRIAVTLKLYSVLIPRGSIDLPIHT